MTARTITLADEIRRLTSVADAHAFLARLQADGEELTAQTYAALIARIDALRKMEAGQ